MIEHRFLAESLPREVARALDRLGGLPDVARLAVMPDVHLAEDVCVGVVLATRRLLYPAAVGGDIGCGVSAMRLDLAELGDVDRILDRLAAAIPAERHRRADFAPWPEGLDPEALSAPSLRNAARRTGAAQLGTLGSGNHFIEIQRDEEGALWLMLHSGSRGLGPAVRAHHARGLIALEADSPDGQAYLGDVDFCVRYAAANRRALRDAALAVLGARAEPGSEIECDHNHVRRELHGDELLWVHRKGALRAEAGDRAVIPGSMGTPSYHVEGRGHPEALRSSSHGAGRAMSRTQARSQISERDLDRQLRGVAYDRKSAADLREEAPRAYKDIGRVMRAQHDLTRIVRRVLPVLAFKTR